MAKQSIITGSVGGAPGDVLMADKLNQLWGLNSFEIDYNTDGTINTVTDLVTSVVYTFAYNTNGTINTVEDDDNIWTLDWNTDGTIAGVTRTDK